MYTNKFIVFIDILGFGALVEKSGEMPDIAESILDALISMNPKLLHQEMFGTLNEEKIPEDRLDDVKRTVAQMNLNMSKMHPVAVSYFSDSLVLSADANDVIASQTILELLAKLSIKLWDEHSLLIRGGVTLGKLVHTENGPLFGPAMNRAYYLESEKAVTPRIIFDEHCIEAFRNIHTFEVLEPLIEKDEKYHYISLPACFRYITTSSTLAYSDSDQLRSIQRAESEVLLKIRKFIASSPPQRIKEKYEWLDIEVQKILSS
ncbi:hypothetical protein RC083_09125 [Pseudoalteromonas haloplanktis]|uniref:Guanylate cyclase domain-containing protein n=1 Tax=Pseudoalteromonas haloplanktis TaxID=228 RepID=A0ABU1BDR9_PSEHA|nr:hypothetical protein [Pseudoalteromonas haloplanktis]MDQ9091752.1 hypothetical protein [Pseudoalteromonas haloplanktis]